ncbi:SulP family inorganic anion transporter [Salinispira pacifica]|uniref:Sulfate permease family protein n=1 Tax=Salinispira pacifica TaxID=1307761 RepID=V5WDL9_9SPIO|nr:SulP family inorganic anion transporter [Salinispira pacifica]AHC13908.1 Sulfate permease family protein [Salinispira pacifica]
MSPKVNRLLPEQGRWPADLLAALSLMVLLIPQAMAQSSLAGMPPVYGLFTAAAALTAGGLMGHLHRFSGGPTSLTALTIAAVIGGSAQPGSLAYFQMVMILALMVGVFRIVLGLLKFSFFANLISHPAASGFTSAAALLIIFSVLGNHNWRHIPTLLVGSGFILLSLIIKRRGAAVLSLVIPMLLFTAAALIGGYEDGGGELLGRVEFRVPRVHLLATELSVREFFSMAVELIPAALLVTTVSLMEMFAVSSHLVRNAPQRMNLDRELISQGAGALGAALAGTFPGSASFARSALLEHQHVSSRFSNLTAGILVIPLAFLCGPILASMPRVILGGIIIVSVIRVIRPESLRDAWRSSWLDALVWLAAFGTTLISAPNIYFGIIVPVLLQLMIFVLRRMRPRVVILGRHGDGRLRDALHLSLPLPRHILAIRLDSSLHFANQEYVIQRVLDRIKEMPRVEHLIISAEGMHYIDESGAQGLLDLAEYCRSRSIQPWIAGIKLPALQVLCRREVLIDDPGAKDEHPYRYARDMKLALDEVYGDLNRRGIVETVDIRSPAE